MSWKVAVPFNTYPSHLTASLADVIASGCVLRPAQLT